MNKDNNKAIELFCEIYGIKIHDLDEDEKEIVISILDTTYAIKFHAKTAQETIDFIEQIDCEFSRLFSDAPDAHLGEMMNVATNMSGMFQFMEYAKVLQSPEMIAYQKKLDKIRKRNRRLETLEYLFPHLFAK